MSRAKQGGFQDWADLRNHLIDAYGATPHPSTEQEIIDAYELHPHAVTKAGLDLIGAVGVTSPWGVLKSRAAKIGNPPSNPTFDAASSREKRIARAEQWIKTTGCHIDRPDEILDELFGDSSGSKLLRDYAQVDLVRTEAGWTQTEPKGDTALVTQILDLWAEHRPTGMRIEREAQERADTWKQQQADLKAALAKAADELSALQPAPKEDPPGDLHDQPTPNDAIPF